MRPGWIQGTLSLFKWPFRILFSSASVRRRIAFEMVQKHYEDLNVVVPLPGGVQCPILSVEHWVSFDNIFAQREYDYLLARIPLPGSWLDIGCHAGHFTLLLASLWARSENPCRWRALLIDADSRSVRVADKIVEKNRFDVNQVTFLHGAIAAGSKNIRFAENAYMTSEIVPETWRGSLICSVPIIHECDILDRFKPPYDLIKLDIEGAEFDFFDLYTAVLSQAKQIICEWHSWHRGGGGKAQLIEMAAKANFQLAEECHSERIVQRNGRAEKCGLLLLKNNKMR
jgi:FkbM family methyltransferase